MRFASLGGQSNYAQAGKAAAREGEKALNVTRQNSVDFGGLARAGMQVRSDEKVAATKAGAYVERANIAANKTTKLHDAKMSQAKSGVMRKAGGLIALGVSGLAEKSEKRDYSLYDKKIAGIKEKNATDTLAMNAIDTSGKKTETPTNTGGTGASNTSTTSSSGSTSITPIANGSYTGSLDSLSADDKKWISYAVSSEAALGTDDEFGVAGVLINRMKSGNYPTTAYDVAHQKGQFEGVEIGNSVHDQKLHDRLFSPEGLTKLEGALTTLDGRDSFKGQALLHNRSSKGNKDGMLDPMFHSSGNFFHRSNQT
jgi:spore germination cell wall hydrolase CwlJ-like protein